MPNIVSNHDADAARDLLDRARRARMARVALAREDINEFCRFVLKDEFTGKPIQQAAVHEHMQRLADKHSRLAFMAFPESGKTQQLAVARVLFALGHNPNLRLVVVSWTHGKATETVMAIRRYIETSKELREVFPNLKPADPWTDSAFTVQREAVSRNPSVKAYGFEGDITGARVDGMIIDDLVTGKNTQTKTQRDRVYNWVFGTLWSRLTPSAWVIIMANAWHPDDLVHRLDKNREMVDASSPSKSTFRWHVERMPVVDARGNSVWPERWPLERIESKREELGPIEFARQYMCLARAETDARFTEAAITTALGLGQHFRQVHYLEDIEVPDDIELPNMPPRAHLSPEEMKRWVRETLAHHQQYGTPLPFIIATGVDLAVQRHAAADLTAFCTIAVFPDGRRLILELKAGRFTFASIVQQIIDIHERFSPTVIMVENVAAQDYLLQHLRDVSDAPIEPYTTGAGKADPSIGIDSIAYLVENGKYIIPGAPTGNLKQISDKEIKALVEDMLFYSPTNHTGDRLMALWFADMAVRKLRRRRPGVQVETFGGTKSKAPPANAATVPAEDVVATYRKRVTAVTQSLRSELDVQRTAEQHASGVAGRGRPVHTATPMGQAERRAPSAPASASTARTRARTPARDSERRGLPSWYPKDME